MIDVSIILVNYKTPKMTNEAIDSIINKSHDFTYEIIVVDNSCDDEEFTYLNDIIGKKAELIKSPSNLGFGKANNMGAIKASGKYLFFLNTDTLLINNAIYELYSFIENNDNIGVVGSNLYTIDEKPNHSFHKKIKNVKNDVKDYSILTSIRNLFIKKRVDFNYSNKPIKINGYVCGASLMIKKELFDKLGGFEKDIFMYAEESLLCYRVLHELNYKIYNIPSSKIIHLEGGSAKKSLKKSKIDMYIDGNYVYYCKAFNENVAKEYLYKIAKAIKKKIKFANKFKNDLVEELTIYYECYEDKLKAINKTEA